MADLLMLAQGAADLVFRASGVPAPADMSFNPAGTKKVVATSTPINPLGEDGRQTYGGNRGYSADASGNSPVGDQYNPQGVTRGAGEAGASFSPMEKLTASVAVAGFKLPLVAWLGLAAGAAFLGFRLIRKRGM